MSAWRLRPSHRLFEASSTGRPSFSALLVVTCGFVPGLMVPSQTQAGTAALIESGRQSVGGSSMRDSQTGLLLVDYYESFLRERDLEHFRDRVMGRYTDATLARVLASSASVPARRAAVLALGVIGEFEQSNAPLGRALRDEDPVVRTMAESALWALWFRADTPENNQALDEIRQMISHHRLAAAVDQATRLVTRSPRFAEAFNQRAIALFFQGRYAESAEDCQRVLKLNPYHIGAVSGLAQCQLELDQPHEALQTLRRALKLQPYSQSIRRNIKVVEAQIESE
jgi:tetratricopeptide (TPR) repeat protein